MFSVPFVVNKHQMGHKMKTFLLINELALARRKSFFGLWLKYHLIFVLLVFIVTFNCKFKVTLNFAFKLFSYLCRSL